MLVSFFYSSRWIILLTSSVKVLMISYRGFILNMALAQMYRFWSKAKETGIFLSSSMVIWSSAVRIKLFLTFWWASREYLS